MSINFKELNLPIYTNLPDSMNGFHQTLLGKKDPKSFVYYLPDDIIRSIFEQYIKTTNILFNKPSEESSDSYSTIYKWVHHGRIDRDNDLPARIEVYKKTGFAKSFSWYKKGMNIRDDDKPCLVEYDTHGILKLKSWGANSLGERDRLLPWKIKKNGNNLLCTFTTRDDEEYKITDIPLEYGW